MHASRAGKQPPPVRAQGTRARHAVSEPGRVPTLAGMNPVKIYTKARCPYCIRAKQLLDEKGVNYEEIGIDGDASKRREMIAAANGRSTVPQIFIAGRHIGGCDDLYELEEAGQLDHMLGLEGAQPGVF
jgi:glutaredoxin 3